MYRLLLRGGTAPVESVRWCSRRFQVSQIAVYWSNYAFHEIKLFAMALDACDPVEEWYASCAQLPIHRPASHVLAVDSRLAGPGKWSAGRHSGLEIGVRDRSAGIPGRLSAKCLRTEANCNHSRSIAINATRLLSMAHPQRPINAKRETHSESWKCVHRYGNRIPS